MEGQLALPNFPRSGDTIDNTFYFSVPDEKVQKELPGDPAWQPGQPWNITKKCSP
jgi:hypothetical protein